MTLYNGDCLKIMPQLPAQIVNAIITDLPYGTTACKWDSVIPFAPMWEAVKHVLKPRGAFVTTASQPFTSALIMSNVEWFKEEVIWDKKIPSGMSYARFMHMRQHENVSIFCNGVMTYNPQVTNRDEPIKSGGNKYSKTAPISGRLDNDWFEKTYLTKQPTTIIKFDKIRRGSLHPTQKPVALYEYLIKTYTNAGDTVLDMTMGSGTTGVACANTGREFIGIEQDADYFAIAEKRIAEAQKQMKMFSEVA